MNRRNTVCRNMATPSPLLVFSQDRQDGSADIIYRMTTEADATAFALEWIAAWNSHDLEAILSHYDPNVVLISPVAAKILGDPSGIVSGIAALRNYFKKGLELFPELRFELFDVMFGLSSIILCYKNQKDTKSAEFMEFGKNGKVIRVVANYSA